MLIIDARNYQVTGRRTFKEPRERLDKPASKRPESDSSTTKSLKSFIKGPEQRVM
jgi:hypothetical protein